MATKPASGLCFYENLRFDVCHGFVVGHDLTDHTRAALLDGTINILMSHPLQALAAETIAAMVRAADGGPDFAPQTITLPFDIYTSENL